MTTVTIKIEIDLEDIKQMIIETGNADEDGTWDDDALAAFVEESITNDYLENGMFDGLENCDPGDYGFEFDEDGEY